MRVIGLTGGIATGKSTVARLLAQRGAAVVDADAVAREVVDLGTPGLTEVADRFGERVLQSDGTLDRALLAEIVFADDAARADLEAITHPRIREGMAGRIGRAVADGAPLVVAEIPLLYEAGREKDFPDVLLVATTEAVQRERLRERDRLSDEAIDRRLRSQWPIDRKRALATWVIENDGTPEETESRVAEWWASVVEPRR